MNKYEFKRPAVELEKVLVCPECMETLSQLDIGSYGHCPYCNHSLESSPELEDYLLKPAIDHWMKKQSIHTHAGTSNFILPDEQLFK